MKTPPGAFSLHFSTCKDTNFSAKTPKKSLKIENTHIKTHSGLHVIHHADRHSLSLFNYDFPSFLCLSVCRGDCDIDSGSKPGGADTHSAYTINSRCTLSLHIVKRHAIGATVFSEGYAPVVDKHPAPFAYSLDSQKALFIWHIIINVITENYIALHIKNSQEVVIPPHVGCMYRKFMIVKTSVIYCSDAFDHLALPSYLVVKISFPSDFQLSAFLSVNFNCRCGKILESRIINFLLKKRKSVITFSLLTVEIVYYSLNDSILWRI